MTVDTRLPGHGISNSHDARPVQKIILTMKWIRTSRERNMTARWITTLSSKVDLSHAINFRVLCGDNFVTCPSEFQGNETLVLLRVGRERDASKQLGTSRNFGGLGFRVQRLGAKVLVSGCRDWSFGVWVQGLGFRVQGSGSRVQGATGVSPGHRRRN